MSEVSPAKLSNDAANYDLVKDLIGNLAGKKTEAVLNNLNLGGPRSDIISKIDVLKTGEKINEYMNPRQYDNVC